MNRRSMIATGVFLMFLGILYIYVFEPFEDEGIPTPAGIADFLDAKSYKIDPQTILESLNHGETDVFMPVVADPQMSLVDKSVSWLQSDFMKITRALNDFIWKEPLSGWRLYSMNFSTSCQDDPSGFSEGDLYYFKTVFHNNGKIRYTTQNFSISPQYGEVNWAGGSDFPHTLLGWRSLRPHQIEITAERALKIAELNGGKKTRLLVQNKCRIHVRLSGNSNWEITMYQDETGASLFRMEIDPKTGSIH